MLLSKSNFQIETNNHLSYGSCLKLYLSKLIKILFLSFVITSNAHANGSAYGGDTSGCWGGDGPCCFEQYYTHMWVTVPSNSTLFSPTISVNYDTMVACVGYHGVITLGSSNNNCGWIGEERYCARLENENEYCNAYGCTGGTSAGDGNYSCNASPASCTPGGDYSCTADKNGTTKYLCNSSGTYNCNCPDCRDLCAMRICAYLDANENNGFYEYNDSDSTYMPYNQNQGDDGENIWGQTQHNNNEVDEFIGCVDIPIGPYPPPLCDPIIGSSPTVNVMNICEYSPAYEELTGTPDANNYQQTSLPNEPCVLSTATGTPGQTISGGTPSETAVYSIFEKPIVRLFFSNPLPVCSSGYVVPNPPPQTGMDSCFQISTAWTPAEIWQNEQSLLTVCGTKAGDSQDNCIIFPSGRTSGPTGGSTSFGDDYDYFTTYYNEGNGSTDIDEYAYYDPSEYDPVPNQVLAGIYDTYYEDIYPGAGSGDPPVIDIIDYNGNTRYFCAFIDLGVDTCNGNTQTTGNGDGSQICVDEIDSTNGNSLVGCYDRPGMFPPVVSSCLTTDSCYYSSSDNISAQPRISYAVGQSYTNPVTSPETGVIGIELPDDNTPIPFCVLDDNNPNGNGTSTDDPAPCTVYQSAVFSAYITDDTNYTLDSDPYADNGTTTTTMTIDSSGQYTGGMQYVDYVYCRGGTQICLTGYSDTSKNAVSKMVTVTTNGVTSTSASTILTDRIIPPYNPDASTQVLANAQLYNSDTNNWYGSTTTISTYIGYTSTVNGSTTYIVGSGCDNWDCTYDSSELTVNNPVPVTCTETNSLGEVTTYTGTQCLIAFQVSTTTDGGTLQGYQYPGNYIGYGSTSTSPSPWNGCSYDSTANMTECPLYNNGNPAVQQYSVRTLSPMELGQCTEILPPYCDAITDTQWGDSTDGYATWPQTSVSTTGTGTCINGTLQSNSGPPTRNCSYQDNANVGLTPTTYDNGCPVFTQVWGAVTNPCLNYDTPGWWPSQFLAGNSNLLGAIINQFNVRYDYRYGVTGSNGPWFTPYYANADPLNFYTTSNISSNVASYEPWNSGYPGNNSCSNCQSNNGSCKKDGLGETSGYARSYTDGDQEMLYLTASQWANFWINYNLTWTLTSESTSPVDGSTESISNNGCYVYDLKAQSGCSSASGYSTDDPSFLCANNTISANFSSNVKPAIKICKYDDNISFALVDLGNNSITNNSYTNPNNDPNFVVPNDYTNSNYIMQSNVIAYAALQSSYHNDGSFYLTNNISNKISEYDTRTNNGMVMQRAGFTYGVKTDGNLPSDFVPYSAPESISANYRFSTYFYGSYDCSCWCGSGCGCKTCHTGCTNYNPSSSGYTSDYFSPLSIFRLDVDITSDLTAVDYMNSNPSPNSSTYSDFTPNNTSLYVGQSCSTSGDWEKLECSLTTIINNTYTQGNSANNESMFLWTGPTSYNVSNP